MAGPDSDERRTAGLEETAPLRVDERLRDTETGGAARTEWSLALAGLGDVITSEHRAVGFEGTAHLDEPLHDTETGGEVFGACWP